MSGPQCLAGDRVELFWDPILLPALNDAHRTSVGRENGIAQRLVLFIEKEQSLALIGNTDAFDLFTGYAGALQQAGNGGYTLLPQLVHIAFGVAR